MNGLPLLPGTSIDFLHAFVITRMYSFLYVQFVLLGQHDIPVVRNPYTRVMIHHSVFDFCSIKIHLSRVVHLCADHMGRVLLPDTTD